MDKPETTTKPDTVNANLLKRVKPGVFEISTGKKSKPSTIAEGQTELF